MGYGTQAAEATHLPVNRWVKLASRQTLRGYEYGRPVFVPSRGELLHWGVIRRVYQLVSLELVPP